MVVKRAINRKDQVAVSGPLPFLYRALAPLAAERHDYLGLAPVRKYQFAERANAIPLVADEFAQAMRHYPIVFAGGNLPTPVALMGYAPDRNEQIDAEGNWNPGTYIPSYVRRYPFALLRESETSDRSLLCADLSSIQFINNPSDEERLFVDGQPSARARQILDFCQKYEVALQRTRAMMEELAKLDLIAPATVDITRGETKTKVQGFSTVAEERVRALPDDVLAGLARRGVLNLFAAHYMSLSNFSDFGRA
jgi:hypothetical protein